MIGFDKPELFSAALAELDQKKALPTGMNSADIRASWSADLRRRSMFSARTTKATVLQGYKDELAELLSGDTNIATARAKMQDLLDGLGYNPATGFEGDEDELIPPAEPGSLRDLSSNMRVDLVLRTNMQQIANYAFRESGQTPYLRYRFPCYELVRIIWRAVPRGMRLRKGAMEPEPGQDWPSRWASVGGEFYGGGRMIARKDSGIWAELGSSVNFDDALDTDVPPFAFNSGYGWREIGRDEAVALGVILPDDKVDAQNLRMNKGLSVNAQKFDTEFLKACRADLDVAIAKGRLSLK